MTKISVSMLASDYSKFGEEALRMQRAGVDFLHMDVMDGCFVPNISFGVGVIKAVHKVCDAPLDVHLMVNDPIRYAQDFAEAGASILTVHAECTPHLQRAVKFIQSLGVKAGVALNPATPLEELKWVMDDIDMILIMTVNPGFGGQKLIPATIEKTAQAAEMIRRSGRDIELEVDGGVAPATCAALREAGATMLVAGSALYGAPDAAEMLRILRGENK